jgi:hypothetical protein
MREYRNLEIAVTLKRSYSRQQSRLQSAFSRQLPLALEKDH